MKEVTNQIVNADCMDIIKNFPDNSIDLAIVDPPYGIGRFGSRVELSSNGKKIENKINEWDQKPTQEYFDELFRVSKHCIIWGANNFELPPTEYFIVWDKKQTVDNFASAEYAWTNCKMPAKVFEYTIHKEMQKRKKDGGKIHPTQKPIKLYQWILKNYAKKGDLILDTHSGSGSCAIACMLEGFDFIAIEKDEQYWKDSVKRLEMEKGKLDGITYDKKMNPVNKKPRLWPKGYGYNQK